MNLLKTSILLFFLFVSFQSHGQDKLEKINNIGFKYKYKGIKYRDSYLPRLFEDNNEALKLFKQFKSSKQVANIFGGTCIGILVIGPLLVSEPTPEEGVDNLLKIAFVGCLAGTTGLIIKSDANNKRDKAIRAFNNGLESTPDLGMSPIEMNVGLTANGVGISITF